MTPEQLKKDVVELKGILGCDISESPAGSGKGPFDPSKNREN
jgi:hypothetical protein